MCLYLRKATVLHSNLTSCDVCVGCVVTAGETKHEGRERTANYTINLKSPFLAQEHVLHQRERRTTWGLRFSRCFA